jgi:hypothetical protein
LHWEKEKDGGIFTALLLEKLREVSIWFISYHDWLIPTIGRTKSLVVLEAFCRTTGCIIPGISTSKTTKAL